MKKLLIPISDDEFKNKINIRFNNIIDGFNSFQNFTLEASDVDDGENKLISFVEKVFENNNSEVYIDFYISKLSESDKKRLIELIPMEDKEILELHLNTIKHNGIFYALRDKSLIPFLVRLNTRETFFVTFYFFNKPITIWGNYDMKFPCFFNNHMDLEFYQKVCKSLGFF
ncbi:hypothetical protein CDLVIII_0201 [Clostridium sp. DL-VIII]|uniref:hypothetical protein n=1 Tax=Clostridium sp. DL-VIII TaxID=641107 RepID=UPI00023AF8AD|nr:hypothetical protein [Clostridium sp. DL-VIII]EHI96939.1 hypothetical protein CDLVIII_0201 [Clostridium sp. DL-VIII]